MPLIPTRLLVCAACVVSSGCAIRWSGTSSKGPAAAANATKDDGPAYGKMTVGIKMRKYADAAKADEKATATEEKTKVAGKAEEGKGKDGAKEKEGAKEGASKGDAKEGGDHHGVLMAIGMFCAISLFSLVVALTQTSNQIISSHSWFVVDQVILIFIAVMNYQAFGSLMDCCIETPQGKILAAFLQAFSLFLIAFFLSWKLKNSPVALAIFCGGGAHFVSFASIHLTEVVEDAYSGDSHLWRKLIVFVGFGVLFFAFSVGVYFLKQRARMVNDDWNDKITDTENDFIAMAMAVVFTTFVFHLVIGKDHDLEVEPDAAGRIERWEEFQLLAYAIVMIPLSIALNKFLSRRPQTGLVSRLVMFFGAFASMCSCWAFIFLGQMHFYSHFCSDKPLFCRIVFAMMTCVVAAVGIVLLAKVTAGRGEAAFAKDVTVALTALSLAAGWSWEQTFDAAIESTADHFGHKVHHLKFMMTISLVCILLPTYAAYIKPVVTQKTACLDG